MKKRGVFVFLVCIFICFNFFTAYGGTRVIGKAIPSDVVVEMNGVLMPSYAVNGEIGVIAEDLELCGFTVEYNNDERMLRLDYQKENQIITQSMLSDQIKLVTLNIYETDVKVNLSCGEAETEISSYNVGGETIVLVKDIGVFADVVWSDEKRVSVVMIPISNWTIDLPCRTFDDTLPLTEGVSHFTISMKKQQDGTWYTEAENEKYFEMCTLSGGTRRDLELRFGFYYFESLNVNIGGLQKMLGPMINERYQKLIHKDTTFANEHMNLLIDGEKKNVIFVKEQGGNNHVDYVFRFEGTTKNLEDIETIEIKFG